MPKRFLIAAFTLLLALQSGMPASAHAEDEAPLLPAVSATGSPLVSVDLHGRWRLRGHYFLDASLGNGTSGFPQTLSTSPQNAGNSALSPSDQVAVGDLRFRFSPVLHVGSRASIHGQFDAVGAAMVLGDNPADATLLGRSLGFAGNGPTRGGLLVRRLWGEFDAFGVATVQLGKVGDHFGLGILRNDGQDMRADFQSDIDRVGLKAELFGFRFALSRDIMASFPRVPMGLASEDLAIGLHDGGDVIRWLVQMHAGPDTGPGFEWGLALAYQDQGTALALENDANFTDSLRASCVTQGTCVQVVPRESSLIFPQAYARWEGRTALGRLSAEGEVALTLGTIENTEALVSTDTSKTVIAGGFAGRLSLATGATTWKLVLGGATGDSEGGFGVLDQANLSIDKGGDRAFRSLLTGFRFHRGFLVDGLLFREVIGAVANAWFARPAWRRTLANKGDVKWWTEVGVLGAAAFAVGSTPGRSRLLGIEPDLLIGARIGERNNALLHATFLAPGGAFDAGEGGTAASTAWRVLAEWHVSF